MSGHSHGIYFLRHGETDWNREGRLQGHRDIPLNDTGRGQARRHGRILREMLAAHDLDARHVPMVASPLSRAHETARIVLDELGLAADRLGFDDRLKEIAYGEWEGLTRAEIASRDPEGQAGNLADPWNFAPAGGESYRALSARVAAWLGEQDGDVIVVAHGGTGRALRGLLLGLAERDIPLLPAPQDTFFAWREGAGRWI